MSLRKKIELIFEKIIFASRWAQAPLYLGLVWTSLLYTYKFCLELYHITHSINTFSEEQLLLGVLTLVDIVMVANLLAMVIIGGYNTFVSKIDVDDHADRPDWLDKVDAGTLKIKLSGALVGISGIHLLKSFIDVKQISNDKVYVQVLIHVTFLASAIFLAVSEWIMHRKHSEEH